MPEIVNPVGIFLPMLVVVLLTILAFIRMGAARAAAVKAGQDPNYYKAYLGDPEPEATTVAVRHYNNMFEMPTVFYAACLTAFVLEAVNGWVLLFAWGFVAGRLVQSASHLTSNNTSVRGMAFSVSVLFLLVLWVNLAMAVFARL